MSDGDERLDRILEVLMAFARQDFSPRIPVSPALDEFDAVATGINMLAEELHGEVASRRELEAAYAALQATQSQLLVAEKFAAIGQLASGVAHELNNPAAWVILNVARARRVAADVRRLTGEQPAALRSLLAELDASLSDVHAGMERIRCVVDNLRTFSRLDEVHTQIVIDDVIRDACQLALPAFRGVARLVLELGELPPIIGDRTRLGQMITNLVINAVQAIGEGGSDHEIAIKTANVAGEALIVVEDTGAGIPDELRERVFEPYFTTKPVDVGTGLGLALVREIATRHGGSVRVGTSTRRGARIEVRLPLEPTSPLQAARPPLPPSQPARGIRILIVDDEPMLLRALAQELGDSHDVITAQGGGEALAVLAEDRDVDLVLCDLQMPTVDGVAVHDALSQSAPDLLDRLVFMSGGAVTLRAHEFIKRVRPRIFEKPLDIDALLALAAGLSRRSS